MRGGSGDSPARVKTLYGDSEFNSEGGLPNIRGCNVLLSWLRGR